LQLPLTPFSVTCTVTLTKSYFRTAGSFCESLAVPVELADALGVMDQECPAADSVPDTAASGRVDTLIVTTLYGCGRLSTTATHLSPFDAAPADETASALNANPQNTAALRILPTLETREFGTARTLSTVPTDASNRYTRKPLAV
jgi:hypothetical protein